MVEVYTFIAHSANGCQPQIFFHAKAWEKLSNRKFGTQRSALPNARVVCHFKHHPGQQMTRP